MDYKFDAEEVVRGQEAVFDRYCNSFSVEKPFDLWNRDSILRDIFDSYHDEQLRLLYDPFPLVYVEEYDLKRLVLVKTGAFWSSFDSDDATPAYAINFPLLASLDEVGFIFLISRFSK